MKARKKEKKGRIETEGGEPVTSTWSIKGIGRWENGKVKSLKKQCQTLRRRRGNRTPVADKALGSGPVPFGQPESPSLQPEATQRAVRISFRNKKGKGDTLLLERCEGTLVLL